MNIHTALLSKTVRCILRRHDKFVRAKANVLCSGSLEEFLF